MSPLPELIPLVDEPAPLLTTSAPLPKPDFRTRADLDLFPEKMGQSGSYEELRDCLHSLGWINRVTLAYRPTFRWLEAVYAQSPRPRPPLHLVDVGCGYGDFLRRVHRWARRRRLPIVLTGIDLDPNAIRAAQEATPPGMVTYITGNAYDFSPPEGIDLVVSSLLTHHLRTPEIVQFMQWMEGSARVGWFINDLHRQEVPYRLFNLLTSIPIWHPLIGPDGLISILRSFRPEDWQQLIRDAHLPADACQVQTFRPARLCVSRLR